MPISPDELRKWVGSTAIDLAQAEGGERLKTRFVAFLVLRHPDVLQRFIETEKGNLFEKEQAILNALSELTASSLRQTIQANQAWELLSEWAAIDEDAYELINSLRPGQ